MFWNRLNWVLLVGVVAAKLVAVMALSRVPGWRPLAQGGLMSLGTGMLISLGKCVTSGSLCVARGMAD